MIARLAKAPLLPGLLLAAGLAACSLAGGQAVVLPAGTSLVVALDAPARSDALPAGATVTGRLVHGVLLEGRSVLPAGLTVALQIVEARSAQVGEPALLSLQLASLELPAGRTPIGTSPLEIVAEPDLAAGPGLLAVSSGSVGAPAPHGEVLGTISGGAVTVAAVDAVVALPAGQKLHFSTSGELRIPRS